MNRPGFTGGLISSEDGPHSRTRGPVPSGTEGDLGRGGPDVYDARVQAEDLEHKPGKRVFPQNEIGRVWLTGGALRVRCPLVGDR